MADYKITTRYVILIIIMSLIIMVGCQKKLSQSQDVTSSKPIQQEIKNTESVYTAELKNITKNAKVVIANNKPCQTGWIPKNQGNTLSEIIFWLQQAKSYKGEILKPKNVPEGENLVFNAYIGPCILNISTSNNHRITIEPASYIEKDDGKFYYSTHYTTNVLEFDYDGKKTYIESSQLFDWLKDNKWEGEFKQL